MKEGQFTVLIASQWPEDRAVLRETLLRGPPARYAVIEAEDGACALELCRALKPDCVILDHDLPDLAATDLLKKLAAEDEAPACGVVMLVGEGDARLAVEAMKSGAHDCLEKNRARGEELLRAVSYSIEMAERQRRGAIPGREIGEEALWVGQASGATGSAVGSRPDRADHKRAEDQGSIGTVSDERVEAHRFHATQRDVTERRRMKEDLRGSEEEFRSLFELSAIGMTQVSREGRYLRVNRKLCQMLGYSEQEMLQLTLHEVTHPDDRERSAAMLSSSFTGAPDEYSIEKRYIRKDSSIIWVLINWMVVRDAEGHPPRTVAFIQDITERKRAEQALRESEALNRAVLGSLAAHVAVLESDGKIIAVNEAWKRFAQENYSKTLAYDMGINYLDVFFAAQEAGNDKASEALEGIRDVLDGALPNFTLEYPCRSGGEKRWFLMSATPLLSERGGAVVSYTDITECKQFEEALRESESRLRQLADAMPQIVYTCGPDGMADYVNQQWRDYIGVSDGRDITETWMETIHPDDRDPVYQKWMESVSTGQTFEVEHRLRRKDGQYRWRLSRAIPIHDREGRIIKWIGTSTDIHDRKQAEAEREELLARAEAARAEAEFAAERVRRLQSVTDSALAPLALDDLLREMLGRIRELLEADSATILLLTADGQSLVVHANTGSDEQAMGLRIPIGQGLAGSIAASRAPLIADDLSEVEGINPSLCQKSRSLIGAPLIVESRLIGVIHADTTRARHFTEDDVRLLQLAADRIALALEQSRLYEVERQARRQAEEANRSKDEFLAVVSHELRSPLNAMIGYATLLRRGGLDDRRAKEAADVIERSGKAQAQLIDDLLDTARIISGKLRLDIGPMDLVAVIEDAVLTILPAANAKGISLRTDLAPEVGQITGDPARLQQVVWNLLSNAVKFTAQSGQVQVRLERIDPHICITVSDTGKGIPPEFMPYVFDRFRQADASSARRYGGLGLGLALVKYLVELHGGTIEAASEGEGRGTTFKILLPVRAIATPVGESWGGTATVKDSKQDALLAGVRALVVDDDDEARDLVRLALLHYGAEVVAASSAAEAYAMITTSPPQERPGVMVTDIAMPGEDGYELVRRLREWERTEGFHIPAVALTAYGRVEDRVRALNAGFQMHITKPVEPAELAAVIASLFRRAISGEKT